MKKYELRHEVLDNDKIFLASIGRRFLALLVDLLLLGILFILLQILFQFMGFDLKHIQINGFTHIEVEGEKMNKMVRLIIQYIFVILPTAYFTLTTYFMNGQSIGKKIFGIRIVSIYHKKVGFWHCLERSLGYVASCLELGLGFVQAFWNTNKMSLHDKIAETIVIQKMKK